MLMLMLMLYFYIYYDNDMETNMINSKKLFAAVAFLSLSININNAESSEDPFSKITKESKGRIVSFLTDAEDFTNFGDVCRDFEECANKARKTQIVHLDASLITKKNIEELKKFGALRLKVEPSDLNHERMKLVGQVVNVIELDLSDDPSSGVLELSDEPLQDEWLKEVGKLTKLTSLNLSLDLEITDEGLRELENLINLAWLNLYQCENITGEGFAQAKFINLSWLNLSHCDITNSGLLIISNKFTKLTFLSVGAMRVNDEGLKDISKLANLDSLSLTHSKITDIGLKEVAKLPNLTKLALLSCNNITDAGLKVIAKLTNLTVVYLPEGKITQAGVDYLQKQLPKLRIVWHVTHLPELPQE